MCLSFIIVINLFLVVDFLSVLTQNKWMTTRALSFALNFVSLSFHYVYTISSDTFLALVATVSQLYKEKWLSNTFYQVPKQCPALLLPLYVRVEEKTSNNDKKLHVII